MPVLSDSGRPAGRQSAGLRSMSGLICHPGTHRGGVTSPYFASTTGSHTALGALPPRSIVTVAFLYASLGAVKMFGT